MKSDTAILKKQVIQAMVAINSHFILCIIIEENAVDSSSASAHNRVVIELIEELKLQERLIPCDKVDLRDCIGQG